MCLQPTACTVEQSVICAKWIVRIEAYATTLEASAGASTDSTDPTVQLLTRMQCTPTGMSCNLSFIASQVSQSAVDCDQDLHQINDISLDDDLNLFESTGSLKIIFVCFSIHFNRCPSAKEKVPHVIAYVSIVGDAKPLFNLPYMLSRFTFCTVI